MRERVVPAAPLCSRIATHSMTPMCPAACGDIGLIGSLSCSTTSCSPLVHAFRILQKLLWPLPDRGEQLFNVALSCLQSLPTSRGGTSRISLIHCTLECTSITSTEAADGNVKHRRENMSALAMILDPEDKDDLELTELRHPSELGAKAWSAPWARAVQTQTLGTKTAKRLRIMLRREAPASA